MLTFVSASGRGTLSSKSPSCSSSSSQLPSPPLQSAATPQTATFSAIPMTGSTSAQAISPSTPSLEQIQSQLQQAAQSLQGVLDAVPHGPEAVLRATQSAAQSSQQSVEQALYQIANLQQHLQQQAASGAPNLVQQAEQIVHRASNATLRPAPTNFTSPKPDSTPDATARPPPSSADAKAAQSPSAAGVSAPPSTGELACRIVQNAAGGCKQHQIDVIA